MSPYRTPAERERGPRWGATLLARLHVKLLRHFEPRMSRKLRRYIRDIERVNKLQTEKLRILNKLLDDYRG